MGKPKIDLNGDGDGDIGKGGIKLIIGLMFDREKTLRSLEKEFNRLMSIIWIIIGTIFLIWLINFIEDRWRANAYIKEFVELEVVENNNGQALIQLREINDYPSTRIGWVTMLLYDKKSETFIDSQIISTEQLEKMDWQLALKKKQILYLSFYSIHHKPLQDFKVNYGFRINQKDWIVGRYYKSNEPGRSYPRLSIPDIALEGMGIQLVGDIDPVKSFKLRDWTPRDWAKFNTITTAGSTVLGDMTYAYCERLKDGKNVYVGTIEDVISFASPYQVSPYHEQQYGWLNAMEIAKANKCTELEELFEKWW